MATDAEESRRHTATPPTTILADPNWKDSAVTIPGLPDHLRCYETSTAGRTVITTRKIPKGETVFAQVPHGHVIHHAHKPTTCDSCFLFTDGPDLVLPFPCNSKCGVHFCSEVCRDASHHGCELICKLQNNDTQSTAKKKKRNKNAHTALSLLVSLTSASDCKNSSTTDQAFDDVLLMMQDSRKSAMRKNVIIEDEFRVLLQEATKPEPQQRKGRYARALATVKLNALGMWAHGEEIGYALSPAMAMVNHSCLPNCQQVTTHGKCRLIALEDIPVGGELTYSYVSLVTDTTATNNNDGTKDEAKRKTREQPQERLRVILDQWEFTCLCARCGDRVDCQAFDAEHTCYCGAICLEVDRSKGVCVCNPSLIHL